MADPVEVKDSILNSIKKLLGMPPEYDAFDVDVLIHINSAFSTLQQLGVGPQAGFSIEDANAVWADFIGTEKSIDSVKTYIYLRVRVIFDPPSTSYAIEAMRNQAKELEWRLNVQVEGTT